ncbi:MAG: hypothetical protein WKF84_03885 [Pyrinomonadaceae bacterium]
MTARRQAAAGASYGGHSGELAASHNNALQMSDQPRRFDQPRIAMGHQRLDLLAARSDSGGPVWEQGKRVARAESDSLRQELSHADPTSRSARTTSACRSTKALENWSVLQRLRIPSRLIVFPGREPLDTEGRKQPLLLSRAAQLAGQVPDN